VRAGRVRVWRVEGACGCGHSAGAGAMKVRVLAGSVRVLARCVWVRAGCGCGVRLVGSGGRCGNVRGGAVAEMI